MYSASIRILAVFVFKIVLRMAGAKTNGKRMKSEDFRNEKTGVSA